jgi:hypothetical protein
MKKRVSWRKDPIRSSYRKEYLEGICRIVEKLADAGYVNIYYHLIVDVQLERMKSANIPMADATIDQICCDTQFVMGRKIRKLFENRKHGFRAIPQSEAFYERYPLCTSGPHNKPVKEFVLDALNIIEEENQLRRVPSKETENEALTRLFRSWKAGHRGAFGLRIIPRSQEQKDPFALVWDHDKILIAANSFVEVEKRFGSERLTKIQNSGHVVELSQLAGKREAS